MKEATFLQSKCTSLLLRSKPVATAKWPAFFQKILKTMRALGVNEIKLTSRNAFIFNLFGLESENESKI